MSAATRLAVDIGGTLTDVVPDRAGATRAMKVPTPSDAPERAVIERTAAILLRRGAGLMPAPPR